MTFLEFLFLTLKSLYIESNLKSHSVKEEHYFKYKSASPVYTFISTENSISWV